MLSLFRRKPSSEPTFGERIDAFWRWFQEVGPRFYATINAGKCASLADEVSTKVDELLPGFCWVFGPGAENEGHSFTLTAEGNVHRQLLALEWLARAPAIEGWTFYAARQPGPIRGHVIKMGELSFDPKEVWVTATVNTDRENIDLIVWYPARENIDPKIRSTVTFLFSTRRSANTARSGGSAELISAITRSRLFSTGGTHGSCGGGRTRTRLGKTSARYRMDSLPRGEQ